MATLIAISVFIFLLFLWSIYSRKANISDFRLNPDEQEFNRIENLTVIVKGIGPGETYLKNCVVLNTNQRICIAQKVVLSKKMRVHYYLWKDEFAIRNFAVTHGILNLAIAADSVARSEDKIIISPQSAILESITLTGISLS